VASRSRGVRNISTEKRWIQVSAWADRLAKGKTEQLQDLEATWCAAVPDASLRTAHREDARWAGKEPLEALFNLVEQGFYPPPELLLALLDAFNAYLDAKGTISLEDVFFGKPTQNAGNFSKKLASRPRERDLAEHYVGLLLWRSRRDGTKLSAEEAATKAIQRFKLQGVSAETLARSIRRRRTRKA
jgi:hypothetical protein